MRKTAFDHPVQKKCLLQTRESLNLLLSTIPIWDTRYAEITGIIQHIEQLLGYK